ncbi:RNA-directed DNA polymerase-like protein [Gossypium australe]|uniref:RNA-directed DNA polymerase-like protein n=1 Tax=Gossypium australe TaxID=47621 RepID=A0A5B6WQZ3_9ROSI|nr:RNA-directed DNA polymerase-like protein [Gossypium australe]
MIQHGKIIFCFLSSTKCYIGWWGKNIIASWMILIHPDDQEKMTYTCLFGTYAFWQMPFHLGNTLATFMPCMKSTFSNMIEVMDIFMDVFSMYGDSFIECFFNLESVLERCEDTSLTLNWEKCHFILNEGIVLGH